MPEDQDNKVPLESDHEETSSYSGEDIPDLDIPGDVPQEHITSSSPVSSGPVEKASKPLILKRFLYFILILILIAVVGLAAWKLIPSKDEAKKPAADDQSQTSSQGQADPIKLALGNTGLTQTYTSDVLRLGFKYPQGWKVSEQNNAIVVKSPAFDLADNTGSTSSTYFKVYIKQGANTDDGKYLGKGYAVASSEKLAYTSPEVGQRKTTYLTDFGLDTADNFAYFVVQGNFNLDKGDTLGPKFASEPESFLIGGGFATDEQKDGLETIILPMDSYKQNLAYQTGVEIVKSLQLK